MWAKREPILGADGTVNGFTITCLHPGCKVIYKNKDGSTGNIGRHLQDDHYLDANFINNSAFVPRQGPMDSMVVRGVKRSAEPWSKRDFEEAYLKFIITSKSSFRTIRNPSLQQLLNLANGAPSKAFVKLPSVNTLRRK
ncbi:hypothetical protein BGW38_007858, partial [Lunasporangiospora selenospora]